MPLMDMVELTSDHTEILITDGENFGTNHKFLIRPVGGTKILAQIDMQCGPVKEYGINGCHIPDLLCICLKQLEDFQRGPHACEENERAVDMIRGSLLTLRQRTRKRTEAGVAGTSAVTPDPVPETTGEAPEGTEMAPEGPTPTETGTPVPDESSTEEE